MERVCGRLLVWEAGHGHETLKEVIFKERKCSLQIELPADNNYMRGGVYLLLDSFTRMIGIAFEFGRSFHGAQNVVWLG